MCLAASASASWSIPFGSRSVPRSTVSAVPHRPGRAPSPRRFSSTMRTYCRCLRVWTRCRLRLSAIPAPRRTCRLSRSPVSSSERRHRFRPVQRSFYGGGLYGGGFWSWWRKAMAGHNFPGERRETDWMAEVLANPFKDPAPYGARGSIFVRQPRRVHQGVPAAYRHPALFALGCACPGPRRALPPRCDEHRLPRTRPS